MANESNQRKGGKLLRYESVAVFTCCKQSAVKWKEKYLSTPFRRYDKILMAVSFKEAHVIHNIHPRLSHDFFRFSLELSQLGNFTKVVKKIVEKTPTAFPINGIHLRFSGVSDIYMSTSYGRQSAHFEFFAWKRDDVYNRPIASLAGYQTILQTLV